jgi:hypothetical protein
MDLQKEPVANQMTSRIDDKTKTTPAIFWMPWFNVQLPDVYEEGLGEAHVV